MHPAHQNSGEVPPRHSARPLLEVEGSRCFYCGDAIRGEPAVDHFVPWARYPLDLGHNFLLADGRCNGDKADRLAAFEPLERWCARNARPEWTAALEGRMLAHDIRRTGRVAAWAYGHADLVGATVWERGREGLVGLDPRGGGCCWPELGMGLPIAGWTPSACPGSRGDVAAEWTYAVQSVGDTSGREGERPWGRQGECPPFPNRV